MISDCLHNSFSRNVLRGPLCSVALLLCVMSPACKDSQSDTTDSQSESSAAVRTAQEGEVKLIVRLDRSEAVVGDPIKFTIEVAAPVGVVMEV